MTNLQIHIETSVHCAECRDVLEFFLNGTQHELVQSDVFGITGFVTKASQFFVQKGWREQDDKTWLCARCEQSAVSSQPSATEQRRAA